MKLKRKTINALEQANLLEVIESFTKWYEDKAMEIKSDLYSAFADIANKNDYDYKEVIVRAVQINQGYYNVNLTAEIEVEFE